jgi:response regulator RpfG family c-di-GMP phosphodiesterase
MRNLRPTGLADRLRALLVYDEEEPLRAVEQTLLEQRMSTLRVRTCSEAMAVLRDSHPPALVLTDTSLPDGGWADVLRAAGLSTVPSGNRGIPPRRHQTLSRSHGKRSLRVRGTTAGLG